MKKYRLAKLLIIFFILLCIITSLYYGDNLLLGSFSEFNNDDIKYLRSAQTLIETGKLTYKDVISGNAKSKILKASKKIFSDFGTDTTSAYKTIKNAKSYNFYFIPGKVYICFESYELDLGSSEFELPVGGKYK